MNDNEQIEEMKTKLKPCPLCGSTKVVKTTRSGWGVSTSELSRIECKNCGLKTKLFYPYEEKVEDYWNRRAEDLNAEKTSIKPNTAVTTTDGDITKSC